MTKLAILQYPDVRLHKKAAWVKDINEPRIQKIIDDMLETLHATEHCAGLAATQLDIVDPPRITVINHPDKPGEVLCLVNLEIVEKSGESLEPEGCMSVRPSDIHAKVARAAKIKAKALDRAGKELEFEVTGFLAQCLQHEADHLDGMLYIDRLSTLKKSMLKKKIEKMLTEQK